MNQDPKKLAAGVAAVHEYLEEKKRAADFRRPRGAAESPALWALAGRQEIIGQRALVISRLWK